MKGYKKIVNPKTGKLVRVNSSLGKKIILNYVNVLNKQKGGAMTRFNPAMFTSMCDFGDVQCSAICANWLGVERSYIEVLLYETGHPQYRSRPRLAYSAEDEWEEDSGISAHAMTSILQRHADEFRYGDFRRRFEERGIRLQRFAEKIKLKQFDGNLHSQFSQVYEHIEKGYATLLDITVEGAMGHYAVIGKFRDDSLFIIDPQHHTGIRSGHKSIVGYLKESWPTQTINIGIYINGIVLDASNYIPVTWDKGIFDIEESYTQGYAVLPAKMRICNYYDGTPGSCPYTINGIKCPYVHNNRFAPLRKRLPIPVCHHWSKGACSRGDSCGFAHDESGGGDGAGMGEDYSAPASAAAASAVAALESGGGGAGMEEDYAPASAATAVAVAALESGDGGGAATKVQRPVIATLVPGGGGGSSYGMEVEDTSVESTAVAAEPVATITHQEVPYPVYPGGLIATINKGSFKGYKVGILSGSSTHNYVRILDGQPGAGEQNWVLIQDLTVEILDATYSQQKVRLNVPLGHPLYITNKAEVTILGSNNNMFFIKGFIFGKGHIQGWIHRGHLLQHGGRPTNQQGGDATKHKLNYKKILEELYKNHNNPEFISKVLPKLKGVFVKII